VKIGIVGLPNAGKSTLFNALTEAGAQTGDYPFTTIDPNVAVVAVPDRRLDELAATLRASSVIYEQIEFHDIAGLVPGASQGEGLGNRFLGAIRETEAICHVVRAHQGTGVPHPEGRVDPLSDIELIETELLAADLEGAERRLERVAKTAKSLDKAAVAERDWLEAVVDALGSGRPVREVPATGAAEHAPRLLSALTSKPMLYVVNVDEGTDAVPPEVSAHAESTGAVAVAVSARIESELGELGDPAEAASMRAELGIGESGLDRVIHGAWELLDLISFFTADTGKEAMARAIAAGSTAYEAAGKVHTDIQQGFVRAEVIGWEELVAAGTYAAARDKGQIRTEGRDYLVADGEVLHIRH
jgi:GTP-binding protein YchF